jgi:hypothetical protein
MTIVLRGGTVERVHEEIAEGHRRPLQARSVGRGTVHA